MSAQTNPRTVDEYIASFATDVREILEKIRQTVKVAALEAEEIISYRSGFPTTDRRHAARDHRARRQALP
jgi:uncharacterized protein YdhG (YjbR/CyaY superfamily)